MFGTDTLADAPRERRGALAIEVAFQAVANGFVQQDAGPARAENHGHETRRRGNRIQIHQRLAHRLARERDRFVGGHELRQRDAPTGARIALFAAAVLFDDHRNIETHQRTHVGREMPVAVGHQHDFVHGDDARHDLLDARIHLARLAIDALEPRDFLARRETAHRIDG